MRRDRLFDAPDFENPFREAITRNARKPEPPGVSILVAGEGFAHFSRRLPVPLVLPVASRLAA